MIGSVQDDINWLLANGVSRETLEKALANGGQESLMTVEYDVVFEPVIRRDVRIWLPILGWRPAAVNEFKTVKSKIHLKQRDRAIICEAARLSGLPRATGKRQLSIFMRVPKGQHRWDEDAFWKSTQDACVHAGLLVNDSPVWYQCRTMRYDPERGPLRTTLILEDLP